MPFPISLLEAISISLNYVYRTKVTTVYASACMRLHLDSHRAENNMAGNGGTDSLSSVAIIANVGRAAVKSRV
jgi:hypothetical protein